MSDPEGCDESPGGRAFSVGLHRLLTSNGVTVKRVGETAPGCYAISLVDRTPIITHAIELVRAVPQIVAYRRSPQASELEVFTFEADLRANGGGAILLGGHLEDE